MRRNGSNCDVAGCLRHGSLTPESENSLALQYLSQGAKTEQPACLISRSRAAPFRCC